MPLLLLKRFWPYLAVLLLALAAYAWHRDKVSAAYDRGVADTEEAQALVIAKVKLEKEKREANQALDTAKLSTRLEVLTSENTQLAATVSELSRTSQLCLRDKVRRSAAAENTRSTGPSDGATKGQEPTENLGGAIASIVTDCQHSVDKLVTLQDWIRSLKANGF